jgi:hypothetical protein
MISKLRFFILIIATASLPVLAIADESFIYRLSDIRNQIKMPHMDLQDKLDILIFSKALFEKAYVNYEHKTMLYRIDPIADLNNVELKMNSFTDIQFHDEVLKIYNSLRDQHLNYYLPTPYSCYSAKLPFAFKKYGTGNIIVSNFFTTNKKLFPEMRKIDLGDELVSFDGLATNQYLKTREAYVSASTADAVYTEEIISMYNRVLNYNMVPLKNEAQLTLKNAKGQLYSVNVPWFTEVNVSCLETSSKSSTSLLLNIPHERSSNIVNTDIASVYHDSNVVELDKLTKTNSKSIFYKNLKYAGIQYGYLKLIDFDLTGEQDQDMIMKTLTDILELKFKNTNGLVIDLRDNFGGQIPLAEKMAALFSNSLRKSTPFYIKANPELYHFLQDIEMPDERSGTFYWSNFVLEHMNEGPIVGPAPFTDVNDIDQKYFKKVALLTNSECMSSCEIFTGAMKDNSNAKIFGTDRSTFGSAANYYGDANIVGFYLKVAVPKYINTRFTFRHAHRISDNSLIDDIGILSDVVITETKEEVINPTKSQVIAKILNQF